MRQRSHSPVEVVEDSEPERARPGSASDDEDAPVALRSVQLDLTAPTTSAYFKRSEPAPVASTSTSVPKVFGRRIPPWERLAAAPLPSTSSHARNVSVESCSSSSSSTKRSYSTLITRAEASTTSANGDVPKKVKKVHKAVGTQFQTAAELLSESASGSDHSSPKPKEVILKPSKRVPSKLKNKGKERMIPPPSQKIDALVNSSPSSALDVMMDSSIEVFDLRSNTSESDRAPDSELDLDIPGGSCLGLDRFKYERPTENATSASKRRKNKAILLPSVDPVVLPSRARVRVLDRCPLCDLYFSTSRSAEWKEGHLRTCALTKDYTSETVRVRVEQRILDLAETAEAELRRLDSSRTLFDRTVGKGEGANTHLREVTVVGVEVGEGAEWTREGKEIGKMQKDLEKGMRKPTRDKVIQEAAEIRREGWERERKRGEEAVKVEWGQAQTPRATGVLKPESASSRHAFAGRIEVVLGALGGSGLTQAVTKRRGSESAEDDVFVVDSIAADELMEPPSTQLFAPSALVEKCADTNEIQAVAIPSKLLPKTKRRARRKTSKSDSESDTDEERATRSLWSAAAGHDDEIIQEVVSPPRTRTRPCTKPVSPPSSPSSLLLLSTPEHDRPIHHRRQLEVQLGTPSTTDGSPTRALRSSMTTLGLGVDDDAATSSEGQHSPSRRSLRDEMVIDDDDAKSSSASDVGEGAWEDEIYNDGVMMWDGREEIGTLVVTDDGSSSEDEPLAAVAKRSCAKSTGRKVGRPRKVSTSPSISSPSSTSTSDIDEIVIYSSVNPPPGCPDYSSQSLEQLQRQVKGFGFRVSKEKSVLVDQLIKVWIAMHPPEPPSKSPKVKKPKAAAKKSKSKKKDKEAEAEEEEVDERSLSAKMRESVLANEAIYLKVLRYEPIFFDDIVALAVGNKVKVAKAFLAKWLDDQCITFYTQDPTNGSRRRYK